jgi:hypothetical protein
MPKEKTRKKKRIKENRKRKGEETAKIPARTQCRWREREHVVKRCRDLTAVAALDSRDTRGLAEREVRLAGAVHDQVADPAPANLRELSVPSGHEGAQYGLAGGAQQRAARPPANRRLAGRWSALPSQSTTTISSSAAAGEAAHVNGTMLMPAISASPRAPTVLLDAGK